MGVYRKVRLGRNASFQDLMSTGLTPMSDVRGPHPTMDTCDPPQRCKLNGVQYRQGCDWAGASVQTVPTAASFGPSSFVIKLLCFPPQRGLFFRSSPMMPVEHLDLRVAASLSLTRFVLRRHLVYFLP